MERHIGRLRDPWDFDVFVMPEDARRVLQAAADAGYYTRLAHPHWVGKIYHRRRYVDVIFSSGNGVVRVDPAWFENSIASEVFGVPVRLCPIEEMIWSKSFVMEHERFDGADVLHLVRTAGTSLDWPRLIDRFGPFHRVLLAHLVLFGFVYPNDRDLVPEWVLHGLLARLDEPAPALEPVCYGTLLSRSAYVHDLAEGFRDARLVHGAMSEEQIARWTAGAKRR